MGEQARRIRGKHIAKQHLMLDLLHCTLSQYIALNVHYTIMLLPPSAALSGSKGQNRISSIYIAPPPQHVSTVLMRNETY